MSYSNKRYNIRNFTNKKQSRFNTFRCRL